MDPIATGQPCIHVRKLQLVRTLKPSHLKTPETLDLNSSQQLVDIESDDVAYNVLDYQNAELVLYHYRP
jgi:hypothetical protein